MKVVWSTWNANHEHEIISWNDAKGVLENIALQADPPCLVEFYDPACGRSLGLGVGRSLTVLTYQDSLDPPYFISLGDPARGGVEWFCYGNERTEYMAKNLIPYDQGVDVLRFFIEYNSRSDSIVWEQF